MYNDLNIFVIRNPYSYLFQVIMCWFLISKQLFLCFLSFPAHFLYSWDSMVFMTVVYDRYSALERILLKELKLSKAKAAMSMDF